MTGLSFLGDGFGSFSKRFGSGAGNVLEMEVVTADVSQFLDAYVSRWIPANETRA